MTLFDVDDPWKRPAWQLARPDDPATSHEAAASLRAQQLTEVRQAVLDLLRAHEEGLTDTDIAELYTGPAVSPSGLRTRRSELVELELVEDSGRKARLVSGRWSIVWTAT